MHPSCSCRREKTIVNIVSGIEASRTGVMCRWIFKKYAEYKVATGCYRDSILQCKGAGAKSTFSIVFSPDRSKIASTHGDHTVKIFDVRTGRLLNSLKGHPRTAWCVSFHPFHNNIVASGCLSGEIRLWDLHNGSCQTHSITNGSVVASLAFHPTDDVLAAVSNENLFLLNWKTGDVLHCFKTAASQEYIRVVIFDPLGNWMLTGIMNTEKKSQKPELSEMRTKRNPDNSTVHSISCFTIDNQNANSRSTATMASNKPALPSGTASTIEVDSDHRVTGRDLSPRMINNKMSKIANTASTGNQERHKICTGASTDLTANENTSTEPDPARHTNSSSTEPNPALHRIWSSTEPDPARHRNISSTEPGPARQRNLSSTEPDPTRHANSSSTEPDPGRHRNLSSTEPGSIRQQTQAADAAMETAGNRSEATHRGAETISSETQGLQETYAACRDMRRSPILSDSNTSDVRDVNLHPRRNVSTSATTSNLLDSRTDFSRRERTQRRPNMGNRQQGRREDESLSRSPRSENHNHSSVRPSSDADGFGQFERLNRTPVRADNVTVGDIEVSVVTSPNMPFFNHQSSTSRSFSVSSLVEEDPAIATATARTPRHVHTAIVIGRRNITESEISIRTAINRAIAGAFAGNGEGAVAANIINTTYRLQLWHLNDAKLPDLADTSKNVIVQSCKLHNDGSLDVSQDGSLLATFVPSPDGFPEQGRVCVFSLCKETFGQCLFQRSFGPNAISLSFSPSNGYVLVGLAARRIHVSSEAEQLMGQVFKLPEHGKSVGDVTDDKITLSVFHPRKRTNGTPISVNTMKFHPTPGVGIFYGTNQGTVRHCRIGNPTACKDSGYS